MTSSPPNKPWALETFPNPKNLVEYVTGISTETTVTTTISQADPSKHDPYATLTKSAPTADTSTNWIRKYVAEDHKLTHTSADGQSAPFVRKKLNWPLTSGTSNAYLPTKIFPNANGSKYKT